MMRTQPFATVAVILSAAGAAFAQESVPAAARSAKSGYYSGDLLTRPALTGDWGGVRNELLDKGIRLDIDVYQFLQGNAYGGKSTSNAFRYSGLNQTSLKFDLDKMGLWEGGRIHVLADTKWGDDILGKVNSISRVNTGNVVPIAGESPAIALSQWYFEQDLFEKKLTIRIGKASVLGKWDRNLFSMDPRTQMLNSAFAYNPVLAIHVPYTRQELSVTARPTDWLSIQTAVTDGVGRAGTTGFETLFHGPMDAIVLHEWTFDVKPFDLPGHQRVGILYDNTERLLIDDYDFLGSPLPDPLRTLADYIDESGLLSLLLDDRPRGSSYEWAVWYNFDQYIYTEADDPTQGLGVFGRFGWSTARANPIQAFFSAGLGGKGSLPDRDGDTWGVGYYYLKLSDRFAPRFNLESEQGIEMYYNVEVTPWLRVSPDLQVIINPGGGFGGYDPAIVYGVRMAMSL